MERRAIIRARVRFNIPEISSNRMIRHLCSRGLMKNFFLLELISDVESEKLLNDMVELSSRVIILIRCSRCSGSETS